MEFGFVPKQTVDGLKDVGNWKSRALAIDQLQKALADAPKAALQTSLHDFLQFMLTLVCDPNFKIATSSIAILGDLVARAGRDIEPHVRFIIPPLMDKFSDSKMLVRTAIISMLKKLMTATSVSSVLDHISTSMNHDNWKVREQIINTAIMATAQHAATAQDYSTSFRVFCTGMADIRERVRWVSLEGMALLSSVMQNQSIHSMIAKSHLTASQKQDVSNRLMHPELPTVTADGVVQHTEDLDAKDGDLTGSDLKSTGSSIKLPWDTASPIGPRSRNNHSTVNANNNNHNSTWATQDWSVPTAPDDPTQRHQQPNQRGISGMSLNPDHSNSIKARLGSFAFTQLPGNVQSTDSAGSSAWQSGSLLESRNRYQSETHSSTESLNTLNSPSSTSPWNSSAPHTKHSNNNHAAHSSGPPYSGARNVPEPTSQHSHVNADAGEAGHTALLSNLRQSSNSTALTQAVHVYNSGGIASPIQQRLSGLKHLRASQGDQGHRHTTDTYTCTTGDSITGQSRLANSTSTVPSHSGVSLFQPQAMITLYPPPPMDSTSHDHAGNATSGYASQHAHGTGYERSLRPQPSHGSRSLAQGTITYGSGKHGAGMSFLDLAHNEALSSAFDFPLQGSVSIPSGHQRDQTQQGYTPWIDTNLDQDAGSARQETFSPSKVSSIANLKKRQIEKRAKSAQLPLRPIDDPGGAPGLNDSGSFSGTPKGSDVGTPTSMDGHSNHYGVNPFASKRQLFGGLDSQLSSPSPKSMSVMSIGPGGIGSSNTLQHYDSSDAIHDTAAGSNRHSNLTEQRLLGQGLTNAVPYSMPSSPLGFLAARRNRGLLAASPAPSDDLLSTHSSTSRQPSQQHDGSGLLASYNSCGTTGSDRKSGNEPNKYNTRPSNLSTQSSIEPPSINPPPAAATTSNRSKPVPTRSQTHAAPRPEAGGSGHSAIGDDSQGSGVRDNKPSSAAAPYWEKGTRPLEEVAFEDLTPLQEPERSCKAAVAKMIEANQADRKTMDWQGQYEALNDCRRLCKHHTDVLQRSLHDVVRAAAPTVDQLRSLCVKNSLNLIAELFMNLGKSMDKELDEVVPLLLKKAGEISNAGRENWLAAEADRVLTEMVKACSETRAIASLTACASHKSMHVRAKVASHLDGLLEMYPGVVRSLAASGTASPYLEKLFKSAAGFLDEGALDTRVYGKRIIWGIRTGLGSKQEFDRLIALVQPEQLARKVMDVVENSNGPPPPPSRSVAGSRTGSRQQLSSGSSDPPGASRHGSYGIVNGVLSGGSSAASSPLKATYSISAPSGNACVVPSAGSGSNLGGADGKAALTSEQRKLQPTTSWKSRQQQLHSGASSGAGEPSGGGATATYQAGGVGSTSKGREKRASSYGSKQPAAHGQPGNGSFGARSDLQGQTSAGNANSDGSALSVNDGETVNKAQTLMSSKDFRERLDGLSQVQTLAQSGVLAKASDSQVMPLLDSLVLRIPDGNSKVAAATLECLSSVFPCLKDRLSLGLNTLVPALVAAMGSSNEKVRAAAVEATDLMLAHVEPALLIQHFSHCVSAGHHRGRPMVIVERLQIIVKQIWSNGSRQQLVIKHGIPAAFSLLNESKGEAKAAAQALLVTLATLMGRSLLDHASNLQPALQQRVADAVAAAGV